ncbi:protein-glutamate O-methyltransferase CheR [Ramlibacter ginsenosidimutans]|uniref:Protein-glutamate O-methyltransferase CheR n=1 Tax=Ramlibacter ginsenosidimutans TaxID=502333 RepID=A0A934WQ47_9BURK|nr:protein-glutamate O-methyltransferase CheR [Ramlibacter ginsenosidimutans]MBK6009198.1 protein-glutamate O-methyltransferase CheR [Ramlibacter ginsenosidimutans]
MTLAVADIEIRLLVQAVHLRYGHDFRDYAFASLKRRVLQAQERMGADTISALQEQVLHDPAQFAQLLQYLTVPVSEMFRDPAYFLALRRHVVPVLRTYPSLKVWVAGCSTGEEAYSLAILLQEEGLLERTILYATDINHASLDKARHGIFRLEPMQSFTRNYQRAGGLRSFSDYYTAAYGGALFDKGLRRSITFADHSLATDAVFSETQLVSCRNVLIYFNRALQDRAIGLFHESLTRRGFLGLGSKETLDFSAYADRFEPVSRADRVYRKSGSDA